MKKTSAQVIFTFDDATATAIIDGLQPTSASTLTILKESLDVSLETYGIKDIKASAMITHFIDDATSIPQVSILVLQKYESPVLACAVNEVLSSLAGEGMPTLIIPFVLEASKLKLERNTSVVENIYGIQIGPQTDVTQVLASRHEKAPPTMQIHHEPLACVLQLVRALKIPAFILIGQIGQHKIATDDVEVICKIGETLASASSLQFVKEKVTWNSTKTSKEQEKEPWRALYG
uniref:uncharacterized protein LOC122600339 n=1 Tax=Erigeron canadensis TaxID=72917 RepID=UPI001CB8E47B|nr:uncharacterized protein LOC122600339 [Erigeron canadensis]